MGALLIRHWFSNRVFGSMAYKLSILTMINRESRAFSKDASDWEAVEATSQTSATMAADGRYSNAETSSRPIPTQRQRLRK